MFPGFLPESQAENYRFKIFIYNWGKTVLCLSELLAVIAAP